MSKHTAGPWKAFDNAGKNMQGYQQPSGVHGTGENRMTLICGCFGDIEGGADTASANARLIASAPELLEALEALLETSNVKAIEHGNSYDVRHVKKARDVVAKARGQS